MMAIGRPLRILRVGVRLVPALRNLSKIILLGLVTIATVTPGGNMALGQSSTGGVFTKIDPPNSIRTTATGINDAGQIVGDFVVPPPPGQNAPFHGFLRDPGGTTFTTIDVPNSNQTHINGINSTGQMVGSFTYNPSLVPVTPGCCRPYGFLRDAAGTTYTTINPPWTPNETYAYGINGSGLIVGWWAVAVDSGNNPVGHGFLRDAAGTYTAFDVPGSVKTFALGINDAGQIVGRFDTASGTHGFVRDAAGTTYTTIDVPFPNIGTVPFGINNLGQIVGAFWDPGGKLHGFFRDVDGTYIQIDVPGSTNTQANGINGFGRIVGAFVDATTWHGFVRGKPPVIAVDAGHGRDCPPREVGGTIGPTWGDSESALVLEIAQQVITNLNARGFKGIPTRGSIWCTKLAYRVETAQRENAELFVSIHLNSAPKSFQTTSTCLMLNNWFNPPKEIDSCVSGTEVWYDSRGKYGGGSLALANLVITAQTAPAKPAPPPNGLGLPPHGTGATGFPGIWVANVPKPNGNAVPIYVLNQLKDFMPAVLDEVAFLSNVGGDERRLHDPSFRTQVASVITDAIVKYYNAP